MTATPTKTSLDNITLFHLCYFAIISTRSTSTETARNQIGRGCFALRGLERKNARAERLVLLIKPIVLRRCRCRGCHVPWSYFLSQRLETVFFSRLRGPMHFAERAAEGSMRSATVPQHHVDEAPRLHRV